MKRVMITNYAIVSLYEANTQRLVVFNPEIPDGLIGIICNIKEEGVAIWYIKWSNGVETSNYKSVEKLMDSVHPKCAIYEL